MQVEPQPDVISHVPPLESAGQRGASAGGRRSLRSARGVVYGTGRGHRRDGLAGEAVFRLAKERGARSVLSTWSATPAREMLMSVIELFEGK